MALRTAALLLLVVVIGRLVFWQDWEGWTSFSSYRPTLPLALAAVSAFAGWGLFTTLHAIGGRVAGPAMARRAAALSFAVPLTIALAVLVGKFEDFEPAAAFGPLVGTGYVESAAWVWKAYVTKTQVGEAVPMTIAGIQVVVSAWAVVTLFAFGRKFAQAAAKR